MREEGLRTVRRDPWSSSACLGTGCIEAGYMVGFGGTKEQNAQRSPGFPPARKGGIRPVSDGEGSIPSSAFFPGPLHGSIDVCPPFFGRGRVPCPLPVRTLLSFRSFGFETSPTRRTFLRKEGRRIDPPQRVDSFPPKGTSPTPFPFLSHPPKTEERVRTGRGEVST